MGIRMKHLTIVAKVISSKGNYFKFVAPSFKCVVFYYARSDNIKLCAVHIFLFCTKLKIELNSSQKDNGMKIHGKRYTKRSLLLKILSIR